MNFPEGQVAVVLDGLGVGYEERGDELVALCPSPRHDDTRPSWSINVESGVHYCFSCGFKGTLFTLAVELKGRTYAVSAVEEMERVVPDGFRVDRNMSAPSPDPPRQEVMPRSQLALFTRPPDWALKARDISLEGSEEFGLRWSIEGHWILPFHDPSTHDLIGYQAKGQKDRSYVRNRPTGLKKGETLFGIQVATAEAVVVESPLDAVRLSCYGVPSVALAGSRVSEYQRILLEGYDAVWFALDNDEAGEKETARLKKDPLWTDHGFLHYEGKDPGDADAEQIEQVFRRLR